MEPYRVEGLHGGALEVLKCADGHALLRAFEKSETVAVEVAIGPDDLVGVSVALWRACGLPVPVILERPEVNPSVSGYDGELGVWLSEGGAVVIALGGSCVERSGGGALKTAALIAAYAQAAGPQAPGPDQAGVDKLAVLIAEAGGDPETAARHLLAGGHVTFTGEARDGR